MMAVILSGGKGRRLDPVTRMRPKALVHFAGVYRMIDFVLADSIELDVVPDVPDVPDGTDQPGTAGALYGNISTVVRSNPKWIIVLSSDQVYRMDYIEMLRFHMDQGAQVTVGATVVPVSEAGSSGGVETDESGRITSFVEKPFLHRYVGEKMSRRLLCRWESIPCNATWTEGF